MDGKYVIVRTYSAGVHFGVLKSHSGKEAVLTEARRLWFWKGAFTLNEVANDGVKKGSQISAVVPEIILTEAIEIMPCSENAEKVLRGFEVHQP